MLIPNSVTAALIASLLALPLSSSAGPLDDGLIAFHAGNYQQAFSLWKPLAESGDAKARYNLGLLFQQGLGVEQNLKQARLLYIAAARQGDADAQYQLGLIYYQGEGVFRSNKEAFHWWTQAAAQQQPRAQYNLGRFYAYGIWVKADEKRAITLWQAAARQGYREAVELMIRAHQNGEFGLKIDPGQVEYWKERLK